MVVTLSLSYSRTATLRAVVGLLAAGCSAIWAGAALLAANTIAVAAELAREVRVGRRVLWGRWYWFFGFGDHSDRSPHNCFLNLFLQVQMQITASGWRRFEVVTQLAKHLRIFLAARLQAETCGRCPTQDMPMAQSCPRSLGLHEAAAAYPGTAVIALKARAVRTVLIII